MFTKVGEIVILPDGVIRDLPPILAGTSPDQVQECVKRSRCTGIERVRSGLRRARG